MTDATNLIIFLSDNHSGRYLGAAGYPVKTPNLDRIAASGTRFSSAWCASPLCCPSRAAIATGRYPHQTGYWDNALAYDGRFPTWHHRIRDAGHEVTAIGKLHFRSSDDDNGFTEEIDVMHIVDGKGALSTLLRATQDGVPRRKSHLAIYQDSVVGEAEYQVYDRRITGHAIDWLNLHGQQDNPWVLLVSYPSPHPPFRVPQRFWDMYPLEDVQLPVSWRLDEGSGHPADEYLSWMNHLQFEYEEEFVRRVVAGYCGLITHTDEQIGIVLDEINKLGLNDSTRILYTSDHGEAAASHHILGKANHYEHTLNIPLLMSGPGIPKGQVVNQPVSHIDLFPTLLESMNVSTREADQDLPGRSLWPAFSGELEDKPVFAEYHAMGSRNSGFAWRSGIDKLMYHVDMPKQFFDLARDPLEQHDLIADPGAASRIQKLESELLQFINPEETDRRSKRDQAQHMEKFGGVEAVRKAGIFSRSPIPGSQVELETVQGAES